MDLSARTSSVRGVGLVGPQQVQVGLCSSEQAEAPKPQEAKARKTKAAGKASSHSAQYKVEGEGLQNDATKHLSAPSPSAPTPATGAQLQETQWCSTTSELEGSHGALGLKW